MTVRETEALRLHNSIFTKPAERLTQLGSEPHRWMVTYSDGFIKYDYGCGYEAWRITQVLMRESQNV